MKSSITSNLRPLLRAFQAFLVAIAGLWPMPRNAHAQLYVIRDSKTGIVSEYDAKTGEVINANFITGLSRPVALAVKGNTLFVTNENGGTVGKYDHHRRCD
jgi:hypothetical protein